MTSSERAEDQAQVDPSVPLFTIGTVARRVGVSAPALRMWEERYEVMEPHRDARGRRLYSQNQVEELMWIRNAISQGLTAAEAHRMVQTRRATPPVPVRRTGFREWVLADHAWLNDLCVETVERVTGALLAYVGVHDHLSDEDAESWLLISCLGPDRPEWFTGSAHQAARRHGDRLADGQPVSFSIGEEGPLVTEVAAPVMVEREWTATVALVVESEPDPEGGAEVGKMRDRVNARYEAWKAYATFEKLTGSAPDAADRTA